MRSLEKNDQYQIVFTRKGKIKGVYVSGSLKLRKYFTFSTILKETCIQMNEQDPEGFAMICHSLERKDPEMYRIIKQL